ncbi:hypothetical protein T484DRAFT_1944669 [Baffinella frigidus]|nr:hypothetical protein T484DRAFT_1944669 [Cryptophyta sp. CCMP2293]
MEKLHYPKQIFDRSHVVSPLIIRLGLDDFAELFHDQQITFEAFISLEDDDLIDIGVDTLGARRRIMRAVLELRNALQAPEPPEDEHADDFDPPEYEREEQEGTVPLKEGHQHHVADFLDDYLGRLEEEGEDQHHAPQHHGGQHAQYGGQTQSLGPFMPSMFGQD